MPTQPTASFTLQGTSVCTGAVGYVIGEARVLRPAWSALGLADNKGGEGGEHGERGGILSPQAVAEHQIETELAAIDAAQRAMLHELETLKAQLEAGSPPELEALLDVHAMMLQDPETLQPARNAIRQQRHNAAWALTQCMDALVAQFEAMEDVYLRERKSDVQQVFERLIALVLADGGFSSSNSSTARTSGAAAPDDAPQAETPQILIARDVSPAHMLQFRRSVAADSMGLVKPQALGFAYAGLVTELGGKTSHTAIVARSLGLPALVATPSATQLVQTGDTVVLDAVAGVLLVNPAPQTLAQYRAAQAAFAAQQDNLRGLAQLPCVMPPSATPALPNVGMGLESLTNSKNSPVAVAAADTAELNPAVQLWLNAELPESIAAARAQGAFDIAGVTGVGLLRSEFLFMGRAAHDLPSEDAQYTAYRAALEAVDGLPVIIRTLDIGADKSLDGKVQDTLHDTLHDGNPLGLRAIRYSLAHPAQFQTQLRALLRASCHGPLHILLPLLSTLGEAQQALAHIARARGDLVAEGVLPKAYDAPTAPKIGAMIETPAAALCAAEFARLFDFLSIGSNDLAQYTLAVDRTHPAVAPLYDSAHPAVLRLIAETVAACRAAGKPVSLCGEMAGDPTHTAQLLKLGLRSFSMSAGQLLAVKAQVLGLHAGS